MPYVQFSFNVRCEYIHYACLFVLFLVSVRFVREILPLLDASHDEIMIRYEGIGFVFS